jgi:hypothetical protein
MDFITSSLLDIPPLEPIPWQQRPTPLPPVTEDDVDSDGSWGEDVSDVIPAIHYRRNLPTPTELYLPPSPPCTTPELQATPTELPSMILATELTSPSTKLLLEVSISTPTPINPPASRMSSTTFLKFKEKFNNLFKQK